MTTAVNNEDFDMVVNMSRPGNFYKHIIFLLIRHSTQKKTEWLYWFGYITYKCVIISVVSHCKRRDCQ